MRSQRQNQQSNLRAQPTATRSRHHTSMRHQRHAVRLELNWRLSHPGIVTPETPDMAFQIAAGISPAAVILWQLHQLPEHPAASRRHHDHSIAKSKLRVRDRTVLTRNDEMLLEAE